MMPSQRPTSPKVKRRLAANARVNRQRPLQRIEPVGEPLLSRRAQLITLIGAALTSMFAASCGQSESNRVDLVRMYGQKSAFRYVNLTTMPLTVTYDSREIAKRAGFGLTNGFMLTRPGKNEVIAVLEGKPEYRESLEIPKGDTRTFYATLVGGKPAFIVLGGDPRIGTANSGVLRILNMSEDELISDIKIDGVAANKQLDRILKFKESSDSVEIGPGNYSMTAKVGGREVGISTIAIDAGKSYSLVLARETIGSASKWLFLKNNPDMVFDVAGASPTG